MFFVTYRIHMPRNCVNHPDNICYVRRVLTLKDQQQSETPLVKTCYELYFWYKVGTKTKSGMLTSFAQLVSYV